ncbi:MAG: lytic transglycosylase domain-containing protein [Acidobacteriota bacterium]
MHSRTRTRIVWLALLHAAALCLWTTLPHDADSLPSATDGDTFAAATPAPDEVIILDQLADWIDEDAESAQARAEARQNSTIANTSAWGEAIRTRTASFDLFRRFHGVESQRDYLARLPYGDLIARAADRHNIDGLLIASVIEAESQFRPAAVSPVGAIGLMQLMPTTVDPSIRERLTEPAINIDAGTAYLAQLIRRFDGDLELAAAAYNAGPTRVRRYQGVPPFRETTRYVDKVLRRYIAHHRALWLEESPETRQAALP